MAAVGVGNDDAVVDCYSKMHGVQLRRIILDLVMRRKSRLNINISSTMTQKQSVREINLSLRGRIILDEAWSNILIRRRRKSFVVLSLCDI